MRRQGVVIAHVHAVPALAVDRFGIDSSGLVSGAFHRSTTESRIRIQRRSGTRAGILPAILSPLSWRNRHKSGNADSISFPQTNDSTRRRSVCWKKLLDAMNRGEMPPRKKGVPQPTRQKSRAVTQWMTDYLRAVTNGQKSPSTVLRRLNRYEYVRTMRDLLGVDINVFDPTDDFPPDAKRHGFDNNGEALTLSDYQLQRYVEVAESYLEQAINFDRLRPKTSQWSYSGKDFNGVLSYQRAPVTWRLIIPSGSQADRMGQGDYLEIGHGQPSERHPNFVQDFVRRGGVPADGWYQISIKAAAANRLDHGYQHVEFDRYLQTRLKLALWIAPEARLLEKNASDQRRLAQVWDLPDGEPEVFRTRVWLRKGAIPFVSWANGVSSKGNIRRVAEKHHPQVIRATQTPA